jgi:hypothetical protein
MPEDAIRAETMAPQRSAMRIFLLIM